MVAGRASEAAERALGHLGVPQGQQGGSREGRGGGRNNIENEGNKVKGNKIPHLLNRGIIGHHPVQGHCPKIKAI